MGLHETVLEYNIKNMNVVDIRTQEVWKFMHTHIKVDDLFENERKAAKQIQPKHPYTFLR